MVAFKIIIVTTIVATNAIVIVIVGLARDLTQRFDSNCLLTVNSMNTTLITLFNSIVCHFPH